MYKSCFGYKIKLSYLCWNHSRIRPIVGNLREKRTWLFWLQQVFISSLEVPRESYRLASVGTLKINTSISLRDLRVSYLFWTFFWNIVCLLVYGRMVKKLCWLQDSFLVKVLEAGGASFYIWYGIFCVHFYNFVQIPLCYFFIIF